MLVVTDLIKVKLMRHVLNGPFEEYMNKRRTDKQGPN